MEEEQDESFFASTLQELVGDADAGGAGAPPTTVLTKRKTREMKELEAERQARRAEKRLRDEKKRRRLVGMTKPEVNDMSFERKLRKIATRGVVVLFNAIQTHQQSGKLSAGDAEQRAAKARAKADLKEVSKESFLDLLKRGGKAAEKGTEEGAPAQQWDALRDDYMLGAKLKDFEQEREVEDEAEEADGGFDFDDDE